MKTKDVKLTRYQLQTINILIEAQIDLEVTLYNECVDDSLFDVHDIVMKALNELECDDE